MRRIALFGSLSLLLGTACTSPDEAKSKQDAKTKSAHDGGKTPEPEPEPEPPQEPLATAAISSVQMIEDCPDEENTWRPPPPPSSPPAQAPAQAPSAAPSQAEAEDVPADMEFAPGAMARGASLVGDGGFEQPCTQSTMQIAFTGQGDVESTVVVEEIRLLDAASGKQVATIEAREPASWVDGAYQSWDQTIGPRQEIKSSYQLSVPEWSSVERSIGGKSSFGNMFVLEVELKVGDRAQTVRSAQFPREQPHVIVT